MMSVLEYANDIGKDVDLVIKKCEELGIPVSNKEDMLDEEQIISLDNFFSSTEEVEEELLDDEEIEEIISKVNIKVDDTIKKQKLKKKSEISNSDIANRKKQMYKHKKKLISNKVEQDDNIVIYKKNMTVNDLAEALSVDGVELVKKLVSSGIMIGLNDSISFDDASILVLDYNKELKKLETQDEANFENLEIIDDESDLSLRPPVVTIMGHVDHGKTTLLDTIRKASVASGEAGGITQHIGAYQVTYNEKKITFIDTPGHAAFTEMRARGASVTDIVIIIVAADDGVMPQTIEAIDHAKAAKVPIIVAINKMDKPTANPERVMTDMAASGLTPEEWGGDTLFVKISAATGTGIDELLENILLIAEMQELKANPNRYAIGSVIEAKLDKAVGPIVTLLIQNGTLRIGDPIVAGTTFGKVRTLKNDVNEEIVEALPSTPVSITGLNELPLAGDRFMAFENEKKARSIAEIRKEKAKQKANKDNEVLTLDDLFSKIQEGIKEINIILKADVKGSEEAVRNSLEKIEVEGVKINIVRSGTGTITESDIVLANASNAIIIGFNVRPNNTTVEVAKEYGVEMRLYNIIYKVVEEIEAAMKGMLDPEYEEKTLGQAEVRKLFKFSKTGTIAGCYVTSGLIKNNAKARIIRDGIVVYDGNINSIQREKDSVKEVKAGYECGITIENYNDIKEQDIIEAYEIVEVKK
ncbi:MAG TPA: translation initiation factor IF-2 [Mollicutes bacterium]|nr:translation initiation factor IF-2 [Mollicutes bacterium]